MQILLDEERTNMTAPLPPRVSPGATMAPEKTGHMGLRIIIGVGLVVALVLGIPLGMAIKQGSVSTANRNLASADSTISGLRNQVRQLQGTASSLSGQMQTDTQQLAAAQSQAQHALSIAMAQVKTQDAARQTQLNSEAATLKTQQAQLAAQQGVTQNNQISQDGVYVVGRDIKGGIWHTSGGSQCYYATLGSTDTSNIVDNNNFTGPDTVDLGSAYAFEINGGCTWVKIG